MEETTCDLCGFSFDKRVRHDCDPAVLENRQKQEDDYLNKEKDLLEGDEMYLRDF